jgi:hypothetical protein
MNTITKKKKKALSTINQNIINTLPSRNLKYDLCNLSNESDLVEERTIQQSVQIQNNNEQRNKEECITYDNEVSTKAIYKQVKVVNAKESRNLKAALIEKDRQLSFLYQKVR